MKDYLEAYMEQIQKWADEYDRHATFMTDEQFDKLCEEMPWEMVNSTSDQSRLDFNVIHIDTQFDSTAAYLSDEIVDVLKDVKP